MKLIENWRKAHKLSSMQLMAIAAAVEAVNGALDGVIPAWVSVSLILAAMAVVYWYLRIRPRAARQAGS